MKSLGIQSLVSIFFLLYATGAYAYPSSAIIDSLPGVYHGMDTEGHSCEVSVSKQLGQMKFQMNLADSSTSMKSVSLFTLKKQYSMNYEFRKKYDKHFDPKTANPWLIHYAYYGQPSIFGIYPRTEKLEINWNQTEFFSLNLAVSYSDGGPIESEPDSRNESLTCMYLKK
ncbi:MAG: hypothetical protein ACXVCP_13870 [Bdellovibrio sp.]